MTLKFLSAFLGGIVAYLAKRQLFTRPGETEINFFWTGFLYALSGALAGLFLLEPISIGKAFLAGLMGVGTITNIMKEENFGADRPELTDEMLTEEDIKKMAKQ